jgi:RHS repeat-associated protein
MPVLKGMYKKQKGMYVFLFVIVFVGLLSHAQAAHSHEIGRGPGGTAAIDKNRFYGFNDPVRITPHKEVYPPLKVEDPAYTVSWGTPHLRCHFKEEEAVLKVEVGKAWIAYRFVDQDLGEVTLARTHIKERSVQFDEVFPGVDVKYTVEKDSVLEEIVVYECGITEIMQEITFEGVTPIEEDGWIYFSNGEKTLFGIPPPVMYELDNKYNQCTGLHYELEDIHGIYYLRKVIDEEGLTWLHHRKREYPVVVDATTQSFEDAWESSGLTPYGQYFSNVSEYVSPSTGSLSMKQTDFYLPGRGLDVEITRVYTTPAVFSTGCRGICAEGGGFMPNYEDAPYHAELECPPVDVGNGWQLNFPWIGGNYIHFLDGTIYKKRSENHEGHHFTYENNKLITASGIEYTFNGILQSISDPDGNTIVFGYTGGRLTTITDTIGRVITLDYNDKGQLTQVSYGSYTVYYSYAVEALASVTDPLGRVTSYEYDQRNNWLLTTIEYPTGGYTNYTYSYFSQEADPPDPFNCFEFRKYHVTDQAIYSPQLVKHTTYSYQGDFDGITASTVTVRNEQDFTKAVHDFSVNTNGLITERIVSDAGSTQLRRVDYTHNARKEVINEDIYIKNSYAYTKKYLYDSWGNVIYMENGEGEKTFCCYANTNYEKVFRNYTGDIPEFSNKFPDCSVSLTIHTCLLGSVSEQDTRVIETYCTYDEKGHLLETRKLFQVKAPYCEFSGTFDEEGQTTFFIDLTGIPLGGDVILKVEGLPKGNQVTKTETHTDYKYCTWLNQGYWNGNKYYAKYIEKKPPYDIGYEPVGPFLHYPGTAHYKGYTTWISGYTQYVKTTYTESEDKYPQQIECNIGGGWHLIATNLNSGTAYYSIPVEELIAGQNTLEFTESSSWLTAFQWRLSVPHAVTPIEDISTAFTYDGYGNLISSVDALDNTTSYTYDSQYHTYVTAITSALINTVTANYDSTRGWITTVTDAKGNTTSYEYDILGRITKKINPDITEKEVVYDDQTNTATVYNELDHKTIQYFDGVNRLIKVEWMSADVNLTETYTYNYLNKVKTKTDPDGRIYSYEYDAVGRLTRLFNPDSTFLEVQFNMNTLSLTDENLHRRQYHYDWANRLVWVKEYTDPVNYYVTQYTYDSAGNLTSFTDANGITTSYEYDSLSGVTKTTYPDLTTETFSYDAAGNLLQRTNAHGTTTLTYDSVYQLVSIHYPGEPATTYEYDANGNRISMTDPAGQSFYIYDTRDRLSSETKTVQQESYTVSYAYDAASRLISLVYPDQSFVTYQYDALNRITAIPGYAEFTYDSALLSSVLYENGTATTLDYDNRCRPLTLHTQKGDTDLLFMSYQYDSTGNITQMEYDRRMPDFQWEQSMQTFSYDWLNRLTSSQGNSTVVYSYDSVGNRTSLNNTQYTYNNMNQLLSISDGTTFTYDDTGNVLTKVNDTTRVYTHDTQNKLTQVEETQVIAQYTYDGDGRRVQKTEWVEELEEYQTITSVYSGLKALYEKNTLTGQQAAYIYGPTGRIAKTVSGLKEFYHTDHLGSTRLITDDSGDPVGEIEYEPFGMPTKTGGSNPLYTGKQEDVTGLYYYGARYYDPETGRWIERDPKGGYIENPMSLNRYVYCYNNPLLYTDPDGCDPEVKNISMNLAFEFTISSAIIVGGLGTPVAGVVWGSACMAYRYWLSRNFQAETKLNEEGEPIISIYAKGDTPGVEAYFASITVKEGDAGDYKGYIRNASTTLVSVAVAHNGSGALDLFVSGSGPVLLALAGSGNINIHITDCTGLVTLNIIGTGIVTIYVPTGQEPPQIMGGGEYLIVYYDPEEGEEDES